MLKIRDLRELTVDELQQKKNDLIEEQFNLKMRSSLKALDNPLRLRQIRREYAMIMTVLNEDKLGIKKLAESSVSILNESKASAADKEK